MIELTCRSCRKKFKVDEAFGGSKLPCPGCRTAVVVPASSTDQSERPEADEEAPSALSRFGKGAVTGIALPFLFAFIVAFELGLNALLGINNRVDTSDLEWWVSRNTLLRMVFVLLFVIPLVVAGGFVGHAISGGRWPVLVLGVVIGYLVGSMCGGGIAALLTTPRPRKAKRAVPGR